MPIPDPLPLAQALIRAKSVTPADDGALDILGAALEGLGFRLQRFKFGEVENLYARRGAEGPNFCFAGHTDVVPVGDAAAWSVDPFAAEIRDGVLIGRGAADMKAAIAAMVAAVNGFEGGGSISFLITGDEEGPAVDGTKRVLEALAAQGERLDACLVGEPTSEDRLGDVVKNGRRGSLNAVLTARGVQGHAAYPHKARNPLPALLDALSALRGRRLDTGAPGFEPSNLEVTTIDVGNPAHNVIPAQAQAKLNIRFNTAHTGAALQAWVEETCAAYGVEVAIRVTGEPFYVPPGPLTEVVLQAAKAVTGAPPALTTGGGTSDARFIRNHCPVVELGLFNATAHMVDEQVAVDDVRTLAEIYRQILIGYFAGA